jgi:hypothetical protein
LKSSSAAEQRREIEKSPASKKITVAATLMSRREWNRR